MVCPAEHLWCQPFAPKMREMTWTVGPMFQMELPIFDWNQAKMAVLKRCTASGWLSTRTAYQELTRMVRDKLIMLRQAHDQVVFYRESIMPAVQQNLDVARRSYVSGMEELTVYLQVQEDLLMTRLKLLEYQRDFLVARAELEREVGGKLELPVLPATQPGVNEETSKPE